MTKFLPVLARPVMVGALLLAGYSSFSQSTPSSEKKAAPQLALQHLKANRQALQLTDADLSDIVLSSETTSKNGTRHLYLQQLYQGIEIHNAITTLNLTKDGQVLSIANRFEKDLAKRIKTNKAKVTPDASVRTAARHLGLSLKQSLDVQRRAGGNDNEMLFSTGGISLEPIPAKLVYQPLEDGSLRLAWEVSIYEKDALNWWNVRLDANTGEVLDKDNLVTHCEFDNDGPGGLPLRETSSAARATETKPFNFATAMIEATNASGYNIYPLVTESPSHGPRVFVGLDAADKDASPKGWQHTPNGVLTTTRGNNVFAYEDPDNKNSYTTSYSPDGGAELKFDFPIDFSKQPVTYRDAATTNLFYWNNIMHDVWYQYGFDEASGNFQFDTFGKGGSPNDPVLAEAQDSRNIPIPPPGQTTRNNANFSTPVDGFAPRMQMYLWNAIPDKDMFRITSPSTAAGSYPAMEGTFSKRLTATPVTGKLVLAQTSGAVSAEGCSAYTNAAAVAGNIAVVYRGTCGFADKAQTAQLAGAIAVVVINNAPGAPIAMGGTPTVATPAITIPAVMISQADGAKIRALLDASQEVTVALKSEAVELDGDFDNGIIAHEYGHGISNRLTGGRLTTSCLGNAEQMGEGWSDWFGLILTMKQGDQPTKIRGIGTYASGQPTTGGGIRPAPYTTDFKVNAYTYGATNNTSLAAPHGIGFVWSTMLWDMTWDLIGKYGFDADLYHGKGGNNMAMQLVIDGLKLQPCRPGFVDGRDAILLADRLDNGGANQELIWRAFAKRGLGYSAKQGLSTSRTDQVEAFDMPPLYACSAPSIAVTPTSAGFAGAALNTIYLGYGAQSVTLTASGDPTFAYTWTVEGPVTTGLSSTTVANPVFTPTVAGMYTFTVTAVNSDKCTRTATVKINVIDVRCGNKNDKVQVCHKGKNVLCIGAADVIDHLNHGDMVGACQNASASGLLADEGAANDLQLAATPNPTSTITKLSFTLAQQGAYRLEVINTLGSVVAVVGEGTGNAGESFSYDFNRGKLASGVYIVRLTSGKQNNFTRIMLQD
ncbi:T9SS-dependent M36 family metallopeptidase [Hymenobacter fodinae]|uniref:T9SS type A sorting domain-containing protein n=1 Tax=Hymenobacter fodinae TaxID=2510796 RepID=A0A4Z0P5G9_9BACT|nr:T9SS-dependent M36 family metallopeptidase [Hymenobacter fodinae]TGE07624.1 T9SS type A sorting domain-containing protein [Hymenobacter fodinae]